MGFVVVLAAFGYFVRFVDGVREEDGTAVTLGAVDGVVSGVMIVLEDTISSAFGGAAVLSALLTPSHFPSRFLSSASEHVRRSP